MLPYNAFHERENHMDPESKNPNIKANPAALLVADLAVLNGFVMAFIYIPSERWIDLSVAVLLAIVGAAYLIYRGVYWPGQSLFRLWRRYVF